MRAWAPVVAGLGFSLFVAEGGRLMSCDCGDDRIAQGALGHGELNDEDSVVSTPAPLPLMAGIRMGRVSAGVWVHYRCVGCMERLHLGRWPTWTTRSR